MSRPAAFAQRRKVEEIFSVALNHNQWQEIERLLYEISRREHRPVESIIQTLRTAAGIAAATGRAKFFALKQHLLQRRFPRAAQEEQLAASAVFLPPLPHTDAGAFRRGGNAFVPEMIYVEAAVAGSALARRFQKLFPATPCRELSHHGEYLREHKFSLSRLKTPLVFITRESYDFIRPCPCTKAHLSCGYWILNIGFGCPYDCSYCFLQQYSNFPGIVLPANLDDFFANFAAFYKKIGRPVRIGTGEFCDSLALDHITGYAPALADFFRDKPVFFELKTKSDNVSRLLEIPGSPQVIVGWSLNPQPYIAAEEIGTASLAARLAAAQRARERGYGLAFHFDPIIAAADWTSRYREVIDLLYQRLRPPFRWISLGTLRGTRTLKSAWERRFPDSDIFYGELLLGEDKKLRYPKFLRIELYQTMLRWIRAYDRRTPVYFCMEDRQIWDLAGATISDSRQAEEYLLRNAA
ncbi:MAG: hypothetical protein NC924_08355 [Candidatus Omnitrophica bacterium]|nr:hypothetical protein [Candidatus Omnitrophota bacterium]